MIIVKFSGGLGNQMFEYAHGLAARQEKKQNLKLDLSAYEKDHKRSFSLSPFSISAKKANFFEILYTRVFDRSSYIDGYFQSEKYFENTKDLIKNEFQLVKPLEEKHPIIVEKIKNSNSVSIHIRRTDYIDKQHRYIVLTPKYYENAMNIIVEKIPNPKFFFFSDDIEWVKENISCSTDSEFVSGTKYKDYEELTLMSLCKHNIIANSTFSWWAGWLNKNPNKIVISPKKWFQPNFSEDGLLPEDWVKI